jgi:hypothetical protein
MVQSIWLLMVGMAPFVASYLGIVVTWYDKGQM